MVKKAIICLVITITLFSFISPSQGNYSIEYNKSQVERLHRQRDKYEQVENDLTEEQKHICQLFLQFNEMRLDDANDLETIDVCKQLQHLIVKESENKNSKSWIVSRTLWRIFGVENPLLYSCSRITEICRDSKTMPLDKKLAEIKRQGDISDDYRIREVAIELYTDNNMYDEAIGYCQEQIYEIKEGKRTDYFLYQYQYDLIKTRMRFQFFLFDKAAKAQELNMEEVVNIGPHLVKIDLVQFRAAKKDAEDYIKSKYINPERCIQLFSAHLVGDLEEVREFHNYLKQLVISKM